MTLGLVLLCAQFLCPLALLAQSEHTESKFTPLPDKDDLSPARPETRIPPETSLQAAIAAAEAGTVLVLEAGEHFVPEEGLIIEEKSGLTLEGGGKASLINRSMENVVVSIIHSAGVSLSGLHVTHQPAVKDGRCTAGVLNIEDSQKIRVTRCHLDGCGAFAIGATNVSDLGVFAGKATHNSGGVFYFANCELVSIRAVMISDNYETEQFGSVLPILDASSTQKLTFTGNKVAHNKNRQFSKLEDCFIVAMHGNEFEQNEFLAPVEASEPLPRQALSGIWTDEHGGMAELTAYPAEQATRLTVVALSTGLRQRWQVAEGGAHDEAITLIMEDVGKGAPRPNPKRGHLSGSGNQIEWSDGSLWNRLEVTAAQLATPQGEPTPSPAGAEKPAIPGLPPAKEAR